MEIASIADTAGLRSARELNVSADGTNNAEELGKTAFLELMIAQINNQNPLDPAKNEEFVAQLAQFSSVEGIQNLNESMEDMAASIKASMTLDAAGLVGRSVMASSDLANVSANGFIGNVSLNESASDVKVEISGLDGTKLRTLELGSQTEGTVRFAWNGQDEQGVQQPAGLYRVRAFSEAGGETREFSIEVPDQVVSVSIQSGGAIANLASGSTVPIAQIREIQ